MFLKKIGKKIIFAIRRKKAFFLDFYSQALLIRCYLLYGGSFIPSFPEEISF